MFSTPHYILRVLFEKWIELASLIHAIALEMVVVWINVWQNIEIYYYFIIFTPDFRNIYQDNKDILLGVDYFYDIYFIICKYCFGLPLRSTIHT